MQTNEDISRLLSSTKAYLSGENEGEASTDVVAQVANEVYAQDLLSLMIINISKFEFEVSYMSVPRHPIAALTHVQARKDISHIYNTLLRRQIGTRSPTVEYISGRPDIIFNALKGWVRTSAVLIRYRYSNADVALNTGMILKEMLRYEPLARILLHSDQ
jgi:calcium binding protein 39